MKKIFSVLMIVTIAWMACSKNNNTVIEQPGNGPATSGALAVDGYGHSTKPMAGPFWQLPAGVALTDSVHEYSYCWAFPPYTNVQRKDWKGIPSGFTFCMTFHNTTSSPVTITFP